MKIDMHDVSVGVGSMLTSLLLMTAQFNFMITEYYCVGFISLFFIIVPCIVLCWSKLIYQRVHREMSISHESNILFSSHHSSNQPSPKRLSASLSTIQRQI